MSTLEPSDGEAADPGAVTTMGTLTALSHSYLTSQIIHSVYNSNPFFFRVPRPFMPEFVLFPRVAAVERFVGRQRANVFEAWRRVNSAVDVLRYGDTGDW